MNVFYHRLDRPLAEHVVVEPAAGLPESERGALLIANRAALQHADTMPEPAPPPKDTADTAVAHAVLADLQTPRAADSATRPAAAVAHVPGVFATAGVGPGRARAAIVAAEL